MRRLLDILSSRWLTPVLITPLVVAYVTRLVMTGGQIIMLSQGFDVLSGGADVPQLIAGSRALAVYVAVILIHLFLRTVRSVATEGRAPEADTIDVEEILARSDAYTVATPSEGWLERVAEATPGSWYVANDSGDRVVVWRGPRPLVRAAWRFALLLVLAGVLVSFLTRESAQYGVGDGEVITAPLTSPLYRYDWRFPAPEAEVWLDDEVLGVVQGSISPQLDERGMAVPGELLARPVTADVVLGDADSPQRTVGMWPPAIFDGRFVTVFEVGVAPHVVVSRDDQVIVDRYAKPRIMPGVGVSDVVPLEGLPFSLRFELVGEGVPVPAAAFHVTALEGSGTVVASATVGPGESLDVNGFDVSVPDTRWWVGLSIVDDPGLWIVVVALGLLVIALCVRVWAAVTGTERYECVMVATEQGARLYIGAEASPLARRRAKARLGILAREGARDVSDTLSDIEQR